MEVGFLRSNDVFQNTFGTNVFSSVAVKRWSFKVRVKEWRVQLLVIVIYPVQMMRFVYTQDPKLASEVIMQID